MNFSMEQTELPLLARLNGPSVVPETGVRGLMTYRDAVRLCFALRRVRGMCRRTVAEHAGIHAPHITDYLSDDERKREMPAKYIKAFEAVCGNTAISQYIAAQANLTVLEEMQMRRVA